MQGRKKKKKETYIPKRQCLFAQQNRIRIQDNADTNLNQFYYYGFPPMCRILQAKQLANTSRLKLHSFFAKRKRKQSPNSFLTLSLPHLPSPLSPLLLNQSEHNKLLFVRCWKQVTTEKQYNVWLYYAQRVKMFS